MEQQGKKSFAIASLVLGIIACLIAWWGIASGIIAIVCAIVGLVLAIQAKKSYTAIDQKNGIATAGLVLSIIGLVLSTIGFIACGVCVCIGNAALAASGVTADQLNDVLSQLNY